MDKQLFAKLKENGELEIAPHHFQTSDTFIMNFDECEELMCQYGYKPVIGEEPLYDRLRQDIHITYIEKEDCIQRKYEIMDKFTPQFEVNSIDEVKVTCNEKNVDVERIIKENEELKERVKRLEAKQQEMFNTLNSFINQCSGSINKVNDLDTKMNSIKNSINTFNQFIELYNSSKRK